MNHHEQAARTVPPSPVRSLKETMAGFLSGIPMFQTLSFEEILLVAGHVNFTRVAPGETLFREGDRGATVTFVVDGALDVVKQAGTDREVVLGTLTRGRSIGEMAILENEPRSATVRARTGSTLVVLSRSAFDLIVEKHPRVGVKIMKGLACLLSGNLRSTSSQLTETLLSMS